MGQTTLSWAAPAFGPAPNLGVPDPGGVRLKFGAEQISPLNRQHVIHAQCDLLGEVGKESVDPLFMALDERRGSGVPHGGELA